MGKGHKQKQILIELVNPPQSYLAGETVEGRVVIQNEKPTKVKEVVVSLHGSGRVHWTRKKRKGKKTKKISYHAEDYVNQKISLVGEGTLPEGCTDYLFQFLLPSNLPSSFTGKVGQVSYVLEVEMVRPGLLKANRRQVIPITVNGIYDLNLNQTAGKPLEMRQCKGSNWFTGRKGKLDVIMKFPRISGFVPGELLELTCEVANGSNKKVTAMKARLHQNISYYTKGGRKEERKVVAKVKGSGVKAGETEMWIPDSFFIPPALPPTRLGGVCRIIDVDYSLHVKIIVSGWISSKITGKLPVTIGTIPFRSTNSENVVGVEQLPQIFTSQVPGSFPSPALTPPLLSSEIGKTEMEFVVPATFPDSNCNHFLK